MKKKTMMKSILLTFMMTLTVGVSAQTTWVYTYDAVGNRTQRTVTGSKARQKSTTTSINLIDDEKVKAVMDPSLKKLKIETLSIVNSSIFIYDMTGKELFSKVSDTESVQIDLSSLRRGTYILTIEFEGEKKSVKFNR